MSDNLFDEPAPGEDDLFEQDGPGLFDEPVKQDGPDLFAGVPQTHDESTTTSIPESQDPSMAELAAPASKKRERPVDEAPPAPLALYRRYRPDTFADVIGQEHVTEPLQRALLNNRVNHAYLFSGPRGCGKTTSARILARCLNCEQGPTPTPCGQCQSCRDLARGGTGSIDVIEIDAASHGGVDDARDLRERAFFAPVSSRYKIYIIDEAHMVTTQGFNALLKLVEEPPPHVKFIFATTEPEKVIGTIRSRTHHYPFRLVPPKVLSQYLGGLCQAEGVQVDPAVLPLVVRAGAGSVRDSLSVLDQLLGGAQEGGVTYAQALALLGYTPDSLLDRIVDAFAAGDSSEVFATIENVIEQGQDPRRFAEDLLRRLRDLVVVAAVDDAISSGLVDVAGDQGERLVNQAAGLGLGELTRAAEVIANGLTEMRGTTAPRLHLELMCARVLLPGADVDDRGVHARLDRLERRMGMGDPSSADAGLAAPAPAWDLDEPRPQPAEDPRDAVRQAVAAHAGAPAATQTRPAGQVVAPTQRAEATSHPSQAAAQVRPQQVMDEPAAPPAEMAESAPPQPATNRLGVTQVRQQWPTVLEMVKERRRFTWILLSQNAQVIDVQANVLTLGLSSAGARESWERGGNSDILADVLVEHLGAQLRIDAIVDDGAPSHHAPEPAASAARPTPAAPEPPAEVRQAARENILPTRRAPQHPDEPEDEPELSRDDPDLDVKPLSSDELLKGVLGAQRIGDEDL